MASEYRVTITMSPDSAKQMSASGYSLYAFKAVKGPDGGKPLVWFKTKTFSNTTEVKWTESYEAYTATYTKLDERTQITASATVPIDLGQVLNVTDPTGNGTVTVPPGNSTNTIKIRNGTSQPFVCGISQAQGDGINYQPLCAFPLFGNNTDVIIPIQKVVLMFATDPVDTGSVIEYAYSPALLVDLTNANELSVAFDLNLSWTAQPQATILPPETYMVPLLITSGD